MEPTIADNETGKLTFGSDTPPERVVGFVRKVIRGEKYYEGPERRTQLRYPITLPVRVTPLNSDLLPMDEPFVAVTRDISVGGICLYHTRPVKQPFLQLEMICSQEEKV